MISFELAWLRRHAAQYGTFYDAMSVPLPKWFRWKHKIRLRKLMEPRPQ